MAQLEAAAASASAAAAAAAAQLEAQVRVALEAEAEAAAAHEQREALRVAAKAAVDEAREERDVVLAQLEAETLHVLAHANEAQAANFLSSALELRVAELSAQLQQARADLEAIEGRHTQELAQVREEGSDYAESANTMMKQMAEQMMAIQNMAMKKIEGLEKELAEAKAGRGK